MKKMVITLAAVIMAMGLFSCSPEGDNGTESNPYLTFKSSESFTISVENPGWTTGTGTIEYSKNAESWTLWNGTDSVSAEKSGDGSYYLYFRGKGNTTLMKSNGDTKWNITGGTAGTECHGNIMTLLDYENPDEATVGYMCFYGMFHSWTCLTSAPELPAQNLNKECYRLMFFGCTSLKSAPDLPAKNLSEYCYMMMFQSCTSLKKPPVISAENINTWGCCLQMFYGCSSLKVSDTPGTGTSFFNCTTNNAGYEAVKNMFYGTAGTFQENPVEGKTYYWY